MPNIRLCYNCKDRIRSLEVGLVVQMDRVENRQRIDLFSYKACPEKLRESADDTFPGVIVDIRQLL